MFLQFLFFTFIYFIGYWDKNSKICVPSITFHFNAPVLFLWSDKKRALSVCSSPGDTPAPRGEGCHAPLPSASRCRASHRPLHRSGTWRMLSRD